MIDWWFRNRRTGELTVAQVPNVPLAVFAVATGARWIFHPSGAAGTIVAVVATVALLVWAADELVRGVNPWRRLLGGGVVVATAVGTLLR